MRFIQLKIYLSICLPVSINVYVPVAIYYFGFPIFIDIYSDRGAVMAVIIW